MSSSEFDNQQVPTSSSEHQWDSIFEYNYTSTTSPVTSAVELSIDQVVPTGSEPFDWHPNDDYDLTLGHTLDLTTTSPYFGIDGLSLQNDSSPAEPAPLEINEQQQQPPTDGPSNFADATPNATDAEPSPPTDEYYLSGEPINDDSTVSVYEVKKAKEPLRPCRVRIKEGKAPRHACHVEGCDKDFSRNEHLQRHLKTHFGAKPYSCDWLSCEQKFTRKETLERHKKMHCGETSFVCDVCGKNFKRNDCLRLHARMHERAKLRKQWRERKEKKSEDDSRAVGQEAMA